MKRIAVACLVCLWWAANLPLPVRAQAGGPATPTAIPAQRDEAFEREVLARLAAVNPQAVPLFQEATRAMDAGDLPTAKQLYEQVLTLAPDFPDALRRLSYVERGLGDLTSAEQHARRAYELDGTPYNQIALAQALLVSGDKTKAAEALTHAQAAAQALPDDLDVNVTLLYAGAATANVPTIRQASQKLIEIAPDFPLAHYFAGLVAAEDGQWEKAERELLLAQKLGMPAEDVQKALDSGIASQARFYRWLRRGAYLLGGWVAGLGVLFLAGLLLSRVTLAAVQRPQPAAQFETGSGERLIRATYGVVIAITSLYFYLSIPLVIALVLAGAGSIFYVFLVVGRIPIQLAVALGLATLYTLIAIVRSVFTRVKDTELGRPLSRGEAPYLWMLTEEVARRVGTRPVEAIYVTPAPEVGVVERGGLLKQLRGLGQRCLILGLGALPGMTQGQFRAILAHEYGHFSNRDTAGGNLAGQVRASIFHMAYRLAVTGQARWYNPAWLFVNGFHRIFLRITLGASRLQEILADRYAAMAYGARNFIDGLMHVVRQSLLFKELVDHEVEVALHQNRRLNNLYTLPVSLISSRRTQLDGNIEEVMQRPTSPYDSHPAVKERIRLVQQLNATGFVEDSPDPVWSLLSDVDSLQQEMTTIVQTNVWQRQGRTPPTR